MGSMPARADSTYAIIEVVAPTVVIDTNVLTGALLGREGYNRQMLRTCFEERLRPIIGQALFLKYEDVLGRQDLFRSAPLSARERRQLFEAFLSICEWVQVYYRWRPNLRDAADNHILELAVAGSASIIVTNNVADFRGAELRFPEVRILTPKALLQEIS